MPPARYAGNGTQGCFRLTVTVLESVATMVLTAVKVTPSRLSLKWFRLPAMAAASQGVPSWNLTLGRAVMVHTV